MSQGSLQGAEGADERTGGGITADGDELIPASDRGGGRLVLVTCEGWNGQVYLSNVVVPARRIA